MSAVTTFILYFPQHLAWAKFEIHLKFWAVLDSLVAAITNHRRWAKAERQDTKT
jgi:hypothetical protein